MTTVLAANGEAIARAAEKLRQGGLVAFPTDTVWGLAADARNEHAIARLFATKGRQSEKPLPVMVPDTTTAEAVAEFDAPARRLARAYWPGALTIVLPLKPDSGLAAEVTAGQDSVGLRIPKHPVALALLDAFGGPLAVTSANRSGEPVSTSLAAVAKALGSPRYRDDDGEIDRFADIILNGGPSPEGSESTIVAIEGEHMRVLRKGVLDAARVAAVAAGKLVVES